MSLKDSPLLNRMFPGRVLRVVTLEILLFPAATPAIPKEARSFNKSTQDTCCMKFSLETSQLAPTDQKGENLSRCL